MKVDGAPACLLPGNTNEYRICTEITREICLDMAVLLWIYWMDPKNDEENEYDDDSDFSKDPDEEDPQTMEGTVWVSACSAHVPEDALPLTGVIECPGIQGKQLCMDGQSVGPYVLHPESGTQRDGCILSGLTLRPKPPDGYVYFAKEVSPLQERCESLGGCEIERLAVCPVIMGYLTPVSIASNRRGAGYSQGPV